MTGGVDGGPGSGARPEGQAAPETPYAEFRVRIERGTAKRSYRIVASGPGGQVEGRFKLPFSDLELENFILKVGGTRKGVRSLESPEMELAKTFGGRLFGALFDGEVRELYRTSSVEATNAGQGMRITLALTSVPELLRIPWEYLYDRPLFPSTDRRTPIVRYLDLPKPIKPFQIQLPLRILAMVSAPSDAEPIDATQERSKLEAALAPLTKAGAVEIDWLEDANLATLFRRLSSKGRAPYHILHFIGHGGYVNDAKEGVLLFEDEAGRRKPETGDKFGTILRGEESLRLVVLNSCEGARASLDDPFSSVATSLIEHEIPAVIGMQFEITDRAAILFSSEFYAALADGRAVDESVSQARMAIFADNNDIEWGTPVLFMRVTDGRLFDVVPGAAAGAAAPPPEAVAAGPVRAAPPVPPPAAEEPGKLETPAATAAPVLETPATTQAPRTLETPVAAAAPVLETPVAGGPPIRETRGTAEEGERPDVAATDAERKRLEQDRRRRIGVLAVVGTLLGAGLLALLFVFLRPAAGPSIEVSVPPGAGPDVVQVNGTGFAPGEDVNLVIESTSVGTATVAGDGTFSASVTVPAGVESPVQVTALGGTSGRSASGSVALASDQTASTTPEPTTEETTGPTASPVDTSTPGPTAEESAGPTESPTEGATPGLAAEESTGPTPSPVDTSTPTVTSTAAPTPISILFYALRTDPVTGVLNADVFEVDPTTGEERRVTTDPKPDSYPARSPDGTRIVFDSRRGDANQRNIWIREADGSFSFVTDDGRVNGYPAWSPDGSQVAWAVGAAPNREIWVINPFDRSGGQPLTSGSDDLLPSWSSSDVIAFERHIGSRSEIWVIRASGGDAAPLVTDAAGAVGDPAWSPDGSRLAFTQQVDGVNRIFVVDADGQSGLQPLTDGVSCDCEDPTWSPDGSEIAYVGPRGDNGQRPIMVISVLGGRPRQVTSNGLSPYWGH